MANYSSLMSWLSDTRKQQSDAAAQQRAMISQGGPTSQGTPNVGTGFSTGASQPGTQVQQPQSTESPASAAMNGYSNYLKAQKLFGGGSAAGSSLGATGAAYAGSGAMGTGFGLGGSLVAGGASGAGAGSGLGAMLGTYGGASTAAGAGSSAAGFGALGSTTAGGTAGLLGGSGAAAGGTLAGGAAAGGAAGGAAAGGAAGGAAAGGAGAAAGGGLAALGPFAAIAAAILWNESDSKKRGLRDDNPKDYLEDLWDGKVVEQDIEGKWAPKTDKLFGGLGGKLGAGNDQRFFGNVVTGDFGNAWDDLKDSSLGKVFKIFG